MLIPVVILGALSVIVAWPLQFPLPNTLHVFSDFLSPVFAGSQSPLLHDPSFGLALVGLVIGTAASLIGIGLAMRLWYEHRPDPQVVLASLPRVIPLLSYNKFYFDEIYDRALVQPVKAVARTARRVVEPDVMDSWVQGIGELLRGFSLDLRTRPDRIDPRLRVDLHRVRGRARGRVGVHRAMNHIPWLTLLIVIPAGAAILLQLVPRRLTAVVKGLTIVATLGRCGHRHAASALDARQQGDRWTAATPLPGDARLVAGPQHHVPPRHRRYFGLVARAQRRRVPARGSRDLAQGHRPPALLLHLGPADRGRHHRRAPVDRPAAVLHVLGGDARPPLRAAQQLGRRQARSRRRSSSSCTRSPAAC